MRIGRLLGLSCAIAALAAPAAARAGTYEVAVCHDPATGLGTSTDGMSFPSAGAYADAGVAGGCGPGGYVYAALDALAPHGPTDAAAWRFTAPYGTAIAAAQLYRSFYAGASNPFASPIDEVDAIAPNGAPNPLAVCSQTYGCTQAGALNLGPTSMIAFAGLDASAIQGSAGCGGGQTCPAGGSAACPELGADPCLGDNDLYAMVLTLADPTAPLVSDVGGSLTGQGALRGTAAVSFDATDTGSGLYSVSVQADGATLERVPFDADGGRCVPLEAGSARFGWPVPCVLSGSATVPIDTSALADGTHQLTVSVSDAAGNSSSVWSGTVLTRNAPQGGTPVLSGTPRVGSTLSAAPGSWTPAPTGFAYQWWRCDAGGGGCAAIAGATGASYTATAADQYGRLEVSVIASDSAGSASATSEPSGIVADANGYTSAPPAPQLAGGSLPSAAGQAREGATLTAAPGRWSGGPLTYAYRWQRCDAAALGCSPIAGATAPRYVLRPADDYGRVRVVVTATGPGGSTVAASPPTRVIADRRGRTAVPGGVRVANGRGACAAASLGAAFAGGATVDYGSAVALRGTLRCGRTPIAGALIDLSLDPAGGAGAAAGATVRTAADGSFRYVVGRGPSRRITLRYRAFRGGTAVASTTLDLRVRPAVSLAITPSRTTNGHTITFTGAVSGGFEPPGGLTLDVEYLEGSRWMVYDTVRASPPGGRFEYRYTFRRTTQSITYTFRVAIPAGGVAGYPFAPAASPARSVHVDP